MNAMTIRLGVCVAMMTAALGCTNSVTHPDPAPPGVGGGQDGNDAGGSTMNPDSGAGGGSSCSAIWQCATACQDATCAQTCADQGGPTSKQLFGALLACSQQNNCSDDACLQTNCANQVNACVSDAAMGAGQDGGAPPMGGGSLPADLVGKWQSSDGGVTYQFNADGTYLYALDYEGYGQCVVDVRKSVAEQGNVTLQGDTLTTMGTSRTTDTVDCSYQESVVKDSGQTSNYTYTLSNSVLSLTNDIGTITYTKQ